MRETESSMRRKGRLRRISIKERSLAKMDGPAKDWSFIKGGRSSREKKIGKNEPARMVELHLPMGC